MVKDKTITMGNNWNSFPNLESAHLLFQLFVLYILSILGWDSGNVPYHFVYKGISLRKWHYLILWTCISWVHYEFLNSPLVHKYFLWVHLQLNLNCVTMLRYFGVCHHARPVVFQQSGYTAFYWWEPIWLTMIPKELKWSKSAYRLPPRRVAAMVNYHTRINHQVL